MHLGDKEYMVIRLSLELQKDQLNEEITQNGETKATRDSLKLVQQIENNIKDGTINLTLEHTEALYAYLFLFRELTCKMNAFGEGDTESREYVKAATNILDGLEQQFKMAGINISDFMTLHSSRESFNVVTDRINGNIGCNSPCPCGRGKKYKHCCGK